MHEFDIIVLQSTTPGKYASIDKKEPISSEVCDSNGSDKFGTSSQFLLLLVKHFKDYSCV